MIFGDFEIFNGEGNMHESDNVPEYGETMPNEVIDEPKTCTGKTINFRVLISSNSSKDVFITKKT